MACPPDSEIATSCEAIPRGWIFRSGDLCTFALENPAHGSRSNQFVETVDDVLKSNAAFLGLRIDGMEDEEGRTYPATYFVDRACPARTACARKAILAPVSAPDIGCGARMSPNEDSVPVSNITARISAVEKYATDAPLMNPMTVEVPPMYLP
ncbi:MAG: hypothetical protein HY010_11200 [Acidobacteria bacterium]|nr:hypothetical protein [Acidobacteriota bacterium]